MFIKRKNLEDLTKKLEPKLNFNKYGIAILQLLQYITERYKKDRSLSTILRDFPEVSAYKNIIESLLYNGYAKIDNFYSDEQCKMTICEIDKIMLENPNVINKKSDSRVFNINSKSQLIEEYRNCHVGKSICEALWGVPTFPAFSMSGKLVYEEGQSRSSGEGWHRDIYNFMFKTILYLTDVESDNGPFQYIEGSHKPILMFNDIIVGQLEYNNTRVADEKVNKIINKNPNRLKTMTARAGTLLLANTSGIHRGKPIAKGTRYAITNYYYTHQHMGEWMNTHFNPISPIFKVN